MGLIEPISAIPSWEGYKYQGNIAAYVVLIEIQKKIINHSPLSEWEIQIEGQEDFSLLHNHEYITLHQVKSGEVDFNDDSKFAFIAEMMDTNAKFGYFHINTKEKIPDDFINSTCSVIKKLEREYKKNIISKDDPLAKDHEDDYIILEHVNPKHKKGTKYNVLNYNTGGKKDRVSVENAINNIKVLLHDYYDEIISKKNTFLKAHPGEKEDRCCVDVFAKRFDNVNEIKAEGVQIIKSIVMNEKPDWTFADDNYCGFLYDECIRLIDRKVTDFFIERKKNGKCLIQYLDFYQLLTHNYYMDSDKSVEFKYFYILDRVEKLFEEFIKSTCKHTECMKCGNAATCNLLKQITQLLSKDIEDRHKAIFNLLLQKPTISFNNLPNDETITTQLIELLKEISKLTLNEKNVIAASSKNEFYWLSLDESRNIETLRSKIQKGVSESDGKSFLFECDALITCNFKDEYLQIYGSNVNVLEDEQLKAISSITSSGIKEKTSCIKPKKIKLVDTNCAKKELK